MKKTAYSFFIICLIISACSHPEEQGSTVSFTAGKVSINGKPASPGVTVKNGSRILTARNSGCDIMFNEKSIIRIRENADIIIYRTVGYGSMDINRGTMLCFMKKTTAETGSFFSIKTPTMIASIKGTAFCISVENADSTYLCDCSGTIEVHDSYMNEKRLLHTSHHRGIRIKRGSTRLLVTEAGLEHHTDHEMESLALKTGEILDWKKTDGNAP